MIHDRPAAEPIRFYDLDAFTRSYIGAALWSTHISYEDGGNDDRMDSIYDGTDIAPDTLAKMAEDCRQFRTGRTAQLLAQAYASHGFSDESAGQDFWLTRNGHGAGFWDRGLGKVGDLLSDDARAFGSVDLYVGDDGQIHA